MKAVLGILRRVGAEYALDKAIPVLTQAADMSAARAPEWWRWTAYLSVGITARRIAGILATGKDPFRT